MSKHTIPKICPRCNKLCSWFTGKICHNCYRRYFWKRKLKICPRCKRLKPVHAKGLCVGCYQTTFYLEHNKFWNYQKRHNISAELYKQITEKCVACGFDKVVSLHHLDENNKNNSRENLIGLCPNCHQMIHMIKWREEVLTQLAQNSKLENRPLLTSPIIRIKPQIMLK